MLYGFRVTVMNKKRHAKSAKSTNLKTKLSEFPEPYDPKKVRLFVINRFKLAEQSMENKEYEKAAEHMADALFMLSYNEAKRIINLMTCTSMSPSIADRVQANLTELKKLVDQPC